MSCLFIVLLSCAYSIGFIRFNICFLCQFFTVISLETTKSDTNDETIIIVETTTDSSAVSCDDNLSGNSNENTETTDNTVRELDLNGSSDGGHDDSCADVDVGGSGTSRINSTESAVSNVTIEETIYLPVETELPLPSPPPKQQLSTEDNNEQSSSLRVMEQCKAPPNSFETNDTFEDVDVNVDLIEYIVTYEESESEALQRRGSCLSRGGSNKNSIKKKVNLNDSAEIIPPPPPPPLNVAETDTKQASMEEDDEVFSDSVPPKLPRGNMCTPFVTKRGSIPGLAALPDWFREEK